MKKMKRGDMMKKSYVGLDIHEESITGIALNEKGVTEFYDDFPNTKEAVKLSGEQGEQDEMDETKKMELLVLLGACEKNHRTNKVSQLCFRWRRGTRT